MQVHNRTSKALRHAQTSLSRAFVIGPLGTEKATETRGPGSMPPSVSPLRALEPVEGLKHHLLPTAGDSLARSSQATLLAYYIALRSTVYATDFATHPGIVNGAQLHHHPSAQCLTAETHKEHSCGAPIHPSITFRYRTQQPCGEPLPLNGPEWSLLPCCAALPPVAILRDLVH